MLTTTSHSARKRPTQARARQTVDAILEAAAEVFEEHGFDGGTTERIAARAGVSIGSMYQYFPNKGALLVELTARYCEDVGRLQTQWLRWLDTERPPLQEGLRAFVDWLVASHSVRPRLRCLMFEQQAAPEVVRATMAQAHIAVHDGLERWLTGRVAQPRVTAVLLRQAISSLVHQFILHPHPDMPPDVAAREVLTLAEAYLRAVAVEGGS